jgi:hypothetical protein
MNIINVKIAIITKVQKEAKELGTYESTKNI